MLVMIKLPYSLLLCEINQNVRPENQTMVDIQQDILRMLESITINANLPYQIDSLDILLEAEFYFQICRSVFPELNIKLLQISQQYELSDEQKLQSLINLLGNELQLDMSHITGNKVLQGHLLQIHKLLSILEKFSEYPNYGVKENSQNSKRPKSDPNTSELYKEKSHAPLSAPNQAIKNQYEPDINGHKQQTENDDSADARHSSTGNRQIRKKRKKKFAYSAEKKRKRSAKQQRKNMYQSVTNILFNQKNRTMLASMRDNRKKKNYSIVQAKTKYQSYLINYKKQKNAERNRKQLQNKKTANTGAKGSLASPDFDNIEDFFNSFVKRFRDTKYCYLKQIQKKIRGQEIDRMCYNNRLHREQRDNHEHITEKMLDRVNNEFRIRIDLLKQKAESEGRAIKLMKKQQERYLREQKKEMGQNKKKELNKIKQYIDQDNQRVLVNLEEGGRLEKLILDMYKRY